MRRVSREKSWTEPPFARDVLRQLPWVLVSFPIIAVVLRWLSGVSGKWLGWEQYEWTHAIFLAGFLGMVFLFGETRKVRRERRQEMADGGADVRVHARFDHAYIPFIGLVVVGMGIANIVDGGGADVTLFLLAIGGLNLGLSWLDRRKRRREQRNHAAA